jgi:hypothetical protein
LFDPEEGAAGTLILLIFGIGLLLNLKRNKKAVKKGNKR